MEQNKNYISQSVIDEDKIDIKRYISLFISNWYWFAFALFVSFTMAYTINRYSERTYSVSSSLLIKDEKVGGGFQSDKTIFSNTDLFKNQQNLRNEIGILKSFSLNYRVIDSLGDFHIAYVGIGRRNIVESRLYKNCPFEVIPGGPEKQPVGEKVYITISSLDEFNIRINGSLKIDTSWNFGRRFKRNNFDFIIKLKNPEQIKKESQFSNKYLFYFEGPENLANNYANKLSISPIDKDASLVRLSVSGPVPEQEADFLNKLMELYILQGIEVKNRIADSTIKFITNQLDSISRDLHRAEDSLQTFRNANKIINVSNEGAVLQSRLERYNSEKITFDLQKRYYEYLIDYLNSKNESAEIISPSIMGISEQRLVQLVEELSMLQNQKKQIAMNLGESQPSVLLLKDNISRIRTALSEYVTNSLINIQNNLSDVNYRISQVDAEISKLPGTEIRMINIQRAFDLNNTIYTFLLEKKAEAGIARASNVSDNRIIDMAESFNSVQIKPKNRQNLLMAFIFGLFIPGLLISLFYNLNNKIIDKEDIVKRTDTPIIGYISHNESNNEIPVQNKPGSVLSESFRSVRASLRYLIKDTDHPVIAIASTITSEGKTFISINLATVYASLGKKVLLIGLDLRKPRIHKIFNTVNTNGMSEYLSGICDYATVIQKTPVENLYYAPSGPIPPNPAELIGSSKMKTFVELAKEEFDLIIIDTPPIAIVSDLLLITSMIDINIFVVRQRYSSKNTIDLIDEYHKSEKLKNIGIIINDISLSGYYGYGLRYGYTMGYGYSYGSNYYGGYTNRKYGYIDKGHGYYSE